MQDCRKMLPINTTFLLRIYFITSFSSVIFFKLVMAKLVVVFTQFLHIGESSIYSLFVDLFRCWHINRNTNDLAFPVNVQIF